MNQIIMGIDPGILGAVAIFEDNGDKHVFDCPVGDLKIGKSTKKIPNFRSMATLLAPYDNCHEEHVHVFLERVHAMPGQGVTSMFNFGMNFGMWQGIVGAFGYKLTFVTPQAWKKELLQGMSKDKSSSLVRALELFPDLADKLTRKKDIGRAEALLIAEYGRRQLK